MPAVRTPEASRTLTVSCPGILPSPLRDKVGAFHHDRFRGYVSVHFRSGLHPPCLRFAVAVAGHHARLGTRLLVRLCRGRHHRRLNSMRLQGATLTDPGRRLSCTRLFPEVTSTLISRVQSLLHDSRLQIQKDLPETPALVANCRIFGPQSRIAGGGRSAPGPARTMIWCWRWRWRAASEPGRSESVSRLRCWESR